MMQLAVTDLDQHYCGAQALRKASFGVPEAIASRCSILLAEQYLDLAAAVADGFIVLSRGQVVDRSPKDAMSRERLLTFMSV